MSDETKDWKLTISFVYSLRVPRKRVKCSYCNGTGDMNSCVGLGCFDDEPELWCHHCSGTGQIADPNDTREERPIVSDEFIQYMREAWDHYND